MHRTQWKKKKIKNKDLAAARRRAHLYLFVFFYLFFFSSLASTARSLPSCFPSTTSLAATQAISMA
jgi:hypothetical protein